MGHEPVVLGRLDVRQRTVFVEKVQKVRSNSVELIGAVGGGRARGRCLGLNLQQGALDEVGAAVEGDLLSVREAERETLVVDPDPRNPRIQSGSGHTTPHGC
jgi:hypothetical protein